MDSDNSDRLETLADGSIILCPEILKAKRGEPFRFFPLGEKRMVDAEPVDPDVYYYYMSIFNNCELFGLPNGGWANEPGWLLEFLSYFKSLKTKIEQYHHERAIARMLINQKN
jgi:hypothetical protein